MPTLTIQIPDADEVSYEITDPQLTVGRNEGNNIVIAHGSMSGTHAQLVQNDDGSYTLADNNSTNGTFVNGEQIVERKLGGSEEILFGQVSAQYSHPELAAAAPAAPSAPAPSAPPAAAPSAPTAPPAAAPSAPSAPPASAPAPAAAPAQPEPAAPAELPVSPGVPSSPVMEEPAAATVGAAVFHAGPLETRGRPANFTSSSPMPKGRKKKDPAGAAILGLGYLSLLVALGLVAAVFVSMN